MTWRAGLVIALIFTACGGGGGSTDGGEEAAIVLNLGTVSATQASRLARTLRNPLNGTASVSLLPADPGAFSIDETTVPASVAGGDIFEVWIDFEPSGPGAYTQSLSLLFSDGSGQRTQPYDLQATAEAMNWTITPTTPDFGRLLPGQTSEQTISFRNGSALSPIVFESATTGSGVTVVGTPFPISVPAQGTGQITLRFAPTQVTGYGGRLRLHPTTGRILDIPYGARGTAAGEEITDFGSQALTNDLTPEFTIAVPADAASLTIEASSLQEAVLGLYTFEGPGGHVYETATRAGPYRWLEAPGGFAAQIPSSDLSDLQLRAGGGTYKFRFQRISGSTGPVRARAIIERRPNGMESSGVLPLNVFLANGITITADTAATDQKMIDTLNEMSQILEARGLTLGAITYYDVDSPQLDTFDYQDPAPLMTESRRAAEARLNLFFVRSVNSGALLGYSPAIGGTKLNGLASSGVAVAWRNLTPQVIGYVSAHEICHHLGIWHTVEGNGTVDLFTDTPECPVTGTNATCTVEGGGLLMHWQATLGTVLSPAQGNVLRRHPLVEPSEADLGKPRPLPEAPTISPETLRFLQLQQGWCASCRR